MSRIQTRPLVSVIIPAYNADYFIGRTLNSVLGQTYPHFEVIVVDDGSRDRTAEIVRSFTRQDPRIQLIQQSQQGVSAARNLGIARSQGLYIAPLDADDIWYPQKLEKQVDRLEASDLSVGLVYAWSSYIDIEGKIVGKYPAAQLCQPEGEVLIALVFSNFVDNGSNPLIRRSCLERIGGYRSHLQNQKLDYCEDWDLYLRIAEHYRFGLVPEYLIGYRQSLTSATSNCPKIEQAWLLVLSEIVGRHPEIAIAVQNWAKGSFYNYLLGKSYVSGDYWRALIWIVKGVKADPILLLRPGIYLALGIGTLKLLAQPITRLIWQDQAAWLRFKQRFRQTYDGVADEEMELSPRPAIVWKPYDVMYLRRWRTVMRMAQELEWADGIHTPQENGHFS